MLRWGYSRSPAKPSNLMSSTPTWRNGMPRSCGMSIAHLCKIKRLNVPRGRSTGLRSGWLLLTMLPCGVAMVYLLLPAEASPEEEDCAEAKDDGSPKDAGKSLPDQDTVVQVTVVGSSAYLDRRLEGGSKTQRLSWDSTKDPTKDYDHVWLWAPVYRTTAGAKGACKAREMKKCESAHCDAGSNCGIPEWFGRVGSLSPAVEEQCEHTANEACATAQVCDLPPLQDARNPPDGGQPEDEAGDQPVRTRVIELVSPANSAIGAA